MGYITGITAFWILAYAMNIACLSSKTVFNSLYKLIFSSKTKRQTREEFHNMLKHPKLLQFFFLLAVRSGRKESLSQNSQEIAVYQSLISPILLFYYDQKSNRSWSWVIYIFFLNCSGSWANSLNRILGLGVGWVTNVWLSAQCWIKYFKWMVVIHENGFEFHQPQDTNRRRRSCVYNRKQVMNWIQQETDWKFLLVETYLA